MSKSSKNAVVDTAKENVGAPALDQVAGSVGGGGGKHIDYAALKLLGQFNDSDPDAWCNIAAKILGMSGVAEDFFVDYVLMYCFSEAHKARLGNVARLGMLRSWTDLVASIGKAWKSENVIFDAVMEKHRLLLEGPGVLLPYDWANKIMMINVKAKDVNTEARQISEILPHFGREFVANFMGRKELVTWGDFLPFLLNWQGLRTVADGSGNAKPGGANAGVVLFAKPKKKKKWNGDPKGKKRGSCFRCHSPDHFIRDCPLKEDGDNRSHAYYAVRSGKTIGVFDNWDECNASINGFEGAAFKTFAKLNDAQAWVIGKGSAINSSNYECFLAKTGSCPTVRFHVDGKPFSAICDTGASISLVSGRVAGKIVKAKPVTISGIGGSVVLRYGCWLVFSVGGQSYRHFVYVFKDCPADLLLGSDFLAGRAIIDYTTTPCSIVFHNNTNYSKIHDRDEAINNYEAFKGFIKAIQRDVVFKTVKDIIKGAADAKGISYNNDMLGLLNGVRQDIVKDLLAYFMQLWIKRDTLEGDLWLGSIFPPVDIKLMDPEPVCNNKRPWLFWDKKEFDFMVKKTEYYLKRGMAIKEPLDNPSSWNSPMVCADKPQPAKDPYRFAVNYNGPNQKIVSPICNMPFIDSVAQNCDGDIFTSIDIEDGYYNLRLSSQSMPITATTCPVHGRIWMTCLQPGMKGGSELFQSRMDDMMMIEPRIKDVFANAYQDDILVWSKHGNNLASVEQHVVHLFLIMQRLYFARVRPSWRKCKVAVRELEWCGRRITPNGMKVMTKKAQAILDLKEPDSYDAARSFWHMCSWHSQFIKRFGDIMWPITDCLRKGRSKVAFGDAWTADCSKAFNNIKNAISTAVELHRDGPGTYHIYSDASDHQVGGWLKRSYKGKNYVMGYYSHTLNKVQDNWSMPKKELFAMSLCVNHWRHIVNGRDVFVHTDARSWQGLNLQYPKGIVARFLLDILSVCPTVVSISGKDNIIADAMSRLKSAYIARPTRVTVPKQLRYSCFHEVHGSDVGGHFGIASTLNLMRRKYYWKGMDNDVNKWYSQCQHCHHHKVKQGTVTKAPMTPIVSNSPWEVVGLDIVPIKLRNGEKKEALVAVDYGSKELKVADLKIGNADDVIEQLQLEVEWSERCPKTIISDGGSVFTSIAFSAYCADRYIRHNIATPYHQQANGQVERCIRTFKEVLKAKLINDKMGWKKAIKSAQFACNNMLPNASTKFTPHEVTRGYQYRSYMDNIISNFHNIRRLYKKAAKNNIKAKLKQVDDYNNNNKVKVDKFKVNDWVMVLNHDKKKFLDPIRVGPFKIIKVLGNDNYLLYNHYRDKFLPYNAEHIYQYTESVYKQLYGPVGSGDININPVDNVSFKDFDVVKIVNNNINNNTGNNNNDAYSKDLCGKRISVFWPDYKKWYDGVIVNKNSKPGTYDVQYDDEPDKEPIEELLFGSGAVKWSYIESKANDLIVHDNNADTSDINVNNNIDKDIIVQNDDEVYFDCDQEDDDNNDSGSEFELNSDDEEED